MRHLFPTALFLLTFAATLRAQTTNNKALTDSSFVDVSLVIPTIVVELPYATTNNFLNKQLYPDNICYLRKAVAERLKKVQEDLQKQGFGLKIWDGYRPLKVQQEMWNILPDSKYVANPKIGYRHNRGAAVDVTLITLHNKAVIMPTQFDDFTKASHVKAKASKEAQTNREILQNAMKRHGFLPLATEWWHFDAPEWKSYPVEDVAIDKAADEGNDGKQASE